MTVFRPYDRHPIDQRILVIDDIEEFKLWTEKSDLGIHGILFDYPETSERLNNSAKELLSIVNKHKARTHADIYKSAEDTRTAYITYDNFDSFRDLSEQLQDDGISQNTAHIITDFTQCFFNATHEKPSTGVTVRLNDSSVKELHNHQRSLSFAFSGGGTVCMSGAEKGAGEEYKIKPGQILLFDNTVWHKSPAFEAEWEDVPRANLIL